MKNRRRSMSESPSIGRGCCLAGINIVFNSH